MTPSRFPGFDAAPQCLHTFGDLPLAQDLAGLLALLNPLAAIIPFIDPGSKKDAAQTDSECAALARTSGVNPTPVRNPKSAHVPPAPAAASAAASGAAAASAPAPAVAKR